MEAKRREEKADSEPIGQLNVKNKSLFRKQL